MSVGFGFSAGDFIAALELVTTVVNALRESGDSSTEYQSLIKQLYTLESALIRVKQLEPDDAQHAEVVALRQAAAQCQNTIDAFWDKIKKYQPSLRAGGSGSRVRDGWRKIKWALCKREDVVRFKADLMAHTQSIEMLLTTVHMGATRLNGEQSKINHRTLVGKVQDSYFGCMQRMTVMLEQVATGIQQGKYLLEMTAKVIKCMQTNVQIFQVVLNLQNIITGIPGQIDRQQPVYLIDALGRHQPFHLEFVMSAEAFVSVLRANFKDIGPGARKIERGEFAMQDSITKLDVDLSLPWGSCFCPGQQVCMSMVFKSAEPTSYCPKCSEKNDTGDVKDRDIECRNCKMIYRQTALLESKPGQQLLQTQTTPTTYRTAPIDSELGDLKPLLSSTAGLKRKRLYDDMDGIALFRRVRIKTSILGQEKRQPRHGPNFRQLRRLLNDLQNHPSAWAFLNPVNRDKVPDYYEVIKEPMDLSTMEDKLEADNYFLPEDFIRDAELMFNNCRKYNNETTRYAKAANKLEKFMWRLIKAIPELSYLEP